MVVFIIQTVGGKVVHDFSFEMERAISYQAWLNTYDDTDVHYTDKDNLENVIEEIKQSQTDIKEDKIIPLGTVEFVMSFVEKMFGEGTSKYIKPLNVPEPLFPYAQRHIKNITVDEQHPLNIDDFKGGQLYIKSNDKIKADENGLYCNKEKISQEIVNGNYQVSEMIQESDKLYGYYIASEWRCFVHRDELVGLQNYQGDFTQFPNVNTIEEIIYAYEWDFGYGIGKKAWTFDVGVLETGETVLIEAHEFFSCGTYGFEDHNNYYYMIISAWYDVVKHIKECITNEK